MATKKTQRMWILCEAFTMTGGDDARQSVHESLAPWAEVYPTIVECMIALQRHVRNRVRENYEGMGNEKYYLESDVAAVLQGEVRSDKNNQDYYRYSYSTDDREVVWQVYPTEV